MSKLKPWQMHYSQYTRGGGYDSYYHSQEECNLEDEEIAGLIRMLLTKNCLVVDFGCGDGLVSRLIHRARCPEGVAYLGVDPDEDFVDPVTGNKFSPDYVMTADEFIERVPLANYVAVFCFSAEDCGVKAVKAVIEKAGPALVIVRNKSWRTNAPLVENVIKHFVYYRCQTKALQKLLGGRRDFTRYKLRGKDRYYVYIRK